MTSSKLGNPVPVGGEFTYAENELVKTLQQRVDAYFKYMNELEFRKALNELRAIWVEGNNYISVTEPWSVIKENQERAETILRVCINLIYIFAVLSYPIMPKTTENMLAKLGLTTQDMPSLKNFDVAKEISFLKPGHQFEVGEPLFERLTPERIDELKQKYGSSK